MKWWHWLILELLIWFGVISWIYFFPSEDSLYEFSKCFLGAYLIYSIEKVRKYFKK